MKQIIFFLIVFIGYISYCQCTSPVVTNFECGMPTQTILGNGITSISNPFKSGINNSTNVGQYTDDGTSGWDNLLIDYNTVIDLSSNPYLSFKLYSTSSIQVMAKLEGGTAVEKWSDFSDSNTWEEFNYDFSDAINNGNTKLVLFFNAGVETGTASDKYYIDDIRWTNTLSMGKINKISNLISYPNPANDFIYIRSIFEINSYSVIDIHGKVLIIKENINRKSFGIDVSKLISGTYFVKNNLKDKVKIIRVNKK